MNYVPPKLCKYTKLEAVMGYWRACSDLGATPTVPFISVLVAHGALETGNFQIGCWNNNPGNIKADAKFAGSYTCIVLNEELKNPKTGKPETRWFAPEGELTGNPRKGGVLKDPSSPISVPPGHLQTRMRAFATLDDGLEDKIRFLLLTRWRPAFDLAQLGDAHGYVRAIRARGYFTAHAAIPLTDETPYERDVVSLTRTYRPFVEEAADLVRRGLPLSKPPPQIEQDPPPLPARFEHSLLDAETIARLEYSNQMDFYDMLHAPRERLT